MKTIPNLISQYSFLLQLMSLCNKINEQSNDFVFLPTYKNHSCKHKHLEVYNKVQPALMQSGSCLQAQYSMLYYTSQLKYMHVFQLEKNMSHVMGKNSSTPKCFFDSHMIRSCTSKLWEILCGNWHQKITFKQVFFLVLSWEI